MTSPIVLVTEDSQRRTVVEWFESEDCYYTGDPLARLVAAHELQAGRHVQVSTAHDITHAWLLLLQLPNHDVTYLATHTVAEPGAPLERIVKCDGTSTCPEDRHRPSCLGVYRTEDEVRLSVIVPVSVLEKRRSVELSTRAHAAGVAAQFGGGPDAA